MPVYVEVLARIMLIPENNNNNDQDVVIQDLGLRVAFPCQKSRLDLQYGIPEGLFESAYLHVLYNREDAARRFDE